MKPRLVAQSLKRMTVGRISGDALPYFDLRERMIALGADPRDWGEKDWFFVSTPLFNSVKTIHGLVSRTFTDIGALLDALDRI